MSTLELTTAISSLAYGKTLYARYNGAWGTILTIDDTQTPAVATFKSRTGPAYTVAASSVTLVATV